MERNENKNSIEVWGSSRESAAEHYADFSKWLAGGDFTTVRVRALIRAEFSTLPYVVRLDLDEGTVSLWDRFVYWAGSLVAATSYEPFAFPGSAVELRRGIELRKEYQKLVDLVFSLV